MCPFVEACTHSKFMKTLLNHHYSKCHENKGIKWARAPWLSKKQATPKLYVTVTRVPKWPRFQIKIGPFLSNVSNLLDLPALSQSEVALILTFQKVMYLGRRARIICMHKRIPFCDLNSCSLFHQTDMMSKIRKYLIKVTITIIKLQGLIFKSKSNTS